MSTLGYNLLIEGTLRTVDVPKKTAQLLKNKGYEVQLALIATKPKLSYLSTLIRYEELYAINPNQARATPKEHHDFIVNHLVDNTRQLEELAIFERIQFINEIEVVYMIQEKIKFQQQIFFKSYCLGSGVR